MPSEIAENTSVVPNTDGLDAIRPKSSHTLLRNKNSPTSSSPQRDLSISESRFQEPALPHLQPFRYFLLDQVYDADKMELVGKNRREIYLFKDSLTVVQVDRAKKYVKHFVSKQTFPLFGMSVTYFENYFHPFGIRLSQRDKLLIMFGASREEDHIEFTDHLLACIREIHDTVEAEKSLKGFVQPNSLIGPTKQPFYKSTLSKLVRKIEFYICADEILDLREKTKNSKNHLRIYLLNDVLQVIRISRKTEENGFDISKQTFPLQGIRVHMFENENHPFGIRLSQDEEDKHLITFAARNTQSRNQFVNCLQKFTAECLQASSAIRKTSSLGHSSNYRFPTSVQHSSPAQLSANDERQTNSDECRCNSDESATNTNIV